MFVRKRPILSLDRLATDAGISPGYLRDVAERRVDPYREFRLIKSAKGATRKIAVPEPDLAKVQRWLLNNTFVDAEAGWPSFAYRKGASVGDCANVHLGARWLVKLDLRDFFHSIDAPRVAKIFRKVGCDEITSHQLANICTRKHDAVGRPRGYLPQGAPTSGLLANLAAANLDSTMLKLASRHRLKYTRYSDDLTFSSDGDFSRARVSALIRSARGEIARNHFLLNEDKIRISPPGSRLIVLGLLVDSDRVRLRGDFKKTLKWHVYGCARFGPEEYSTSRGYATIEDYRSHVGGLFAHAIDIEPGWAKPLQKSWKDLSAAQADDEPAGNLVTAASGD